MRRAWSDLAEAYWAAGRNKQSATLSALGDLSDHIRKHHGGSSLFGWTSMADLCIAQNDDQEKSDPKSGWLPYLRLSPDEASELVRFRFVDSQSEKNQWTRLEQPDAVIARFEKFLDQLRWRPAIAKF